MSLVRLTVFSLYEKISADMLVQYAGPAVKFSDTKATIRTAPPRLSQHTEEVLLELGIDGNEVELLRGAGVV
jgi:succinate--hydroxymethylglutarate CoA-transferase